ncbi:MAG: glycosyltransferase family 4 protein [Pseudodesulfovibrio sp.]|nr:glycosyltransferase family 4 protein [Pseudodesulfovibrio sp.]
MRIALFIASLGTGGAERVTCIMANYWVGHGHEVHLVTLSWDGAEPAYPLDPLVRLDSFGAGGPSHGLLNKVRSNVSRLAGVRAAIRRIEPDVVISHVDSTNVLVALACVGLGIKPFLVEHIHPPMHDIGPVWGTLRSFSYGLARKVVVLTEATRQHFRSTLGDDKIAVIPNPVVEADSSSQAEVVKSYPRVLLCAGRLVRQKGFDIMLDTFARIAPDFPDWGLVILGEGPERVALETQTASLGLTDRVQMPGVVDNPFYSYGADIFVMPSRYEGFPMALCEAMAAGLPAVSFDCPTGPADIVRTEVDGILVPPERGEELAHALSRMMSDPLLRKALSAKSVEVAGRFSVERVMGVWEQLIHGGSAPEESVHG